MFRCRVPLLCGVFVGWLTTSASADDGKTPAPLVEVKRPRLVVETGHTGTVASVAFSPDGNTVVSGGEDGVARVWDAGTCKEVGRFDDYHGLSPDGRFVLRRRDEVIQVLETLSGAVTAQIANPKGKFTSIAFTNDGRKMLVTRDDGWVRIHSATTGKELKQVEVGKGVRAVASSDGAFILGVGWGSPTASVWDASTGQELLRLKHAKEVTAAAFSPDGKRILTGTREGCIQLWEVGKGSRQFADKGRATLALAFSPDGCRIATGGEDGVVRVWDVHGGEELLQLKHQSETVAAVAFSPDGKRLLTGTGRVETLTRLGTVWIWDAETGKQLARSEGRPEAPLLARISPGGGRLLLPADDATLRVWDVVNTRETLRLSGQASAYLGATGICSPDGKQVATAAWDGTIRVWEIESGKKLQELKAHTEQIRRVKFSQDSKRLLTIGEGDDTVRLWDVASGKEVLRLPQVGSDPTDLSPDGKRVLVTGLNPEGFDIPVLNSDTGKEALRLKGHSDLIVVAQFSPDGKYILTGARDKTVRIWDATSGKEVHRLRGCASKFWSIEVFPDNKRILVHNGGETDPATVYDITNGKELYRIAPKWEVTQVAFSPDGSRMALGDQHYRVSIHNTETGKMISQLKSAETNATFSCEFWGNGSRVLTVHPDHCVRLWDSESGTELAKFHTFQNGIWTVVTPDGRFDTNEVNAIRGLHWVAPDDPFRPLSPEIFMRDYYEPKLLARVLAGAPFKPIRSLTELNRVQPAVKITKVESHPHGAAEVSVTVEVAGRTGTFARPGGPTMLQSGAFDLHLFRDGRLVARHPTEDGGITLDPKTGRAVVRFEHIKLPRTGQQEVEFSAYAFNADRVKSDTHRVKHQLPANLTARKGTAYVVCVGVNAFDDPKWDLKFAAPDARVMSASLREMLGKSDPYERVVVVPLISDARSEDGKRVFRENTATKENLRAVLAILAGQKADARLLKAVPATADLAAARPEDLVLITFSTHGHNGTDGRFYLIPSDIGAEHKGQITDDLLRRSISTDDLSSWLRGVDAGEMVMVVDACHSAGSVEQDGFKPGPMGSRGLGQLAYDKRMRILAASQASDVAFEDPRIGHGLLTYALCQNGLKEGRADFEPADKRITMGEWLRYGVKRVPELADDIAAGKVDASSVAGRPLKKVGGKQAVAQLPSLFDFTKGADGVILAGMPNTGLKKP